MIAIDPVVSRLRVLAVVLSFMFSLLIVNGPLNLFLEKGKPKNIFTIISINLSMIISLVLLLGFFSFITYFAAPKSQPLKTQNEREVKDSKNVSNKNIQGEKVLFDFAHLEYFSPLGISPDKQWLSYLAYPDTSLKLVNIITKKEKVLELENVKSWEAVQWSPDSKLLAGLVRYSKLADIPGGAYPLWILSIDNQQNPRLLYEKSSYAFKWSPNGSKIAVITDDDQSLKIYNSDSFELIKTLATGNVEDYPNGSAILAWSPNSNSIIFPKIQENNGLSIYEVVLWNLTDNEHKVLFSKQESFFAGVDWSSDGSKITLSTKDIPQDKPNFQLKIFDKFGSLLKVIDLGDVEYYGWLSETNILFSDGLLDIDTNSVVPIQWLEDVLVLHLSSKEEKIIYQTTDNLIIEKDMGNLLRDIPGK